MRTVDDPTSEDHVCATPETGLPGDEWTCPVCARVWWADEVESDDGLFITWRPA